MQPSNACNTRARLSRQSPRGSEDTAPDSLLSMLALANNMHPRPEQTASPGPPTTSALVPQSLPTRRLQHVGGPAAGLSQGELHSILEAALTLTCNTPDTTDVERRNNAENKQ